MRKNKILSIFLIAFITLAVCVPEAAVNAKTSDVKFVSTASLNKKISKANKKMNKIIKNDTKIKKSDVFTPGKTYTGTAYYVSESGNNDNDGTSTASPWQTLDQVNAADLKFGDAVFFKRGETFRGSLNTKEGVTYSAYGSGKMPNIIGSPEDGADPSKWIEYGKTSDGGTIWEYYKDMTDCGCIYVNENTPLGDKITPNWNGKYYETPKGKKFNVLTGMNRDLSFFTPADKGMPAQDSGFVDIGGSVEGCTGKFYFRCDKGNPGEVFESIEFGTTPKGIETIIRLVNHTVINNLNIRYGSSLAVSFDACEGAVCQNCELSFCGGYILNYKDRVPERCGDGICASGTNCVIKNCYIHDNWDNGITVENGYVGYDALIKGFNISGNVIMRHAGSAIQFISWLDEGKTVFTDITVDSNYIYESSEGWSYPYRSTGAFENGTEGGACINFGDVGHVLFSKNFVVKNNIFYCKKGAPIWGAVGDLNVKTKNNTFLVTNKRYPIAVFCLPKVTIHQWFWVEGSEESGPDLINKTLGSGNRIIVGK